MTCAELVEVDGEVKIISKLHRMAANKFAKHVGGLNSAEAECLEKFLDQTDNGPLWYVCFFCFCFF